MDPSSALSDPSERPGPALGAGSRTAPRLAAALALGAVAASLGGVAAAGWWLGSGAAVALAAAALLVAGLACGAVWLRGADEGRRQLAAERSAREAAEAASRALRARLDECDRGAELLRQRETRFRGQGAVLAGIARVFHGTLTSRTEEELGRTCLSIAEDVTQSAFGLLIELNPRTGRLEQVSVSDPGWEACRMRDRAGHGRSAPLGLHIRGLYGRVLLEGKSLLTNDPPSHPDSIGTPPGHPPLKAFLGVPLKQDGRTIGMMGLGNREGGYGPEELEAAEAIATATGNAFQHKRAEEALALVTRLYAVLSRVNEAIVRVRAPRELYEEVCRIVAEEAGFPLVWVGLVEGRRVTPSASWGRASGYVLEIRVEVDGELGKGPTGTCVREGRAVINDDFDANAATLPWRAAALRHELRASAAFPLRRRGKVIGALAIYASRPGAFTARHVELLEALSADVSYALDAMEQERLRAEAERALRDSELNLRQVDQRKNEFLAMLSHELRNPLAPVRNSLHLLDRAPPGSPQAARAKEVLGRQVDHLTRLVDDLLDVTRISHGKIELRRTVVDARDLVQKACADHGSVFEQRGIALQLEVPGASLWIDADVTRVSQALRNLLVNAAKFTPEGGKVEVSAARAGDRVEIGVRDDGIGLEPQALERVFEPFVQAERGQGRARGGLGLGLALVKGLVEAHGGSVRAESEGANRGSRFVITLPCAPAPERRPEPARPMPARALDILVIEDNVDGAETLAAVLELHGHRAHIAVDGASGVSRARELKPDVVLCDIDLPGIDGYEVARRLRTEGGLEATRLIALSGYAGAGDRRLALEAGFSAHLAKPISVEELDALLGGQP